MIFPILGLAGLAGTAVFALLMIIMILLDKPFVLPCILMLVFALLTGVSVVMIMREDGEVADNSMGDQSVVDQSSDRSSARNELDAVGDISVDTGLFNVTVTIPSDFVEENMTQEQLDQAVKEHGYKSATLNNDGSVTYVMTKAQHNEMMQGIEQSIAETLDEIANAEDTPNIVKVESNKDYTQYKVFLKTDTVGLTEAFTPLSLYFVSGMYHVFNGTEVDNVNIQFINEETGLVIEEANSKDMG